MRWPPPATWSSPTARSRSDEAGADRAIVGEAIEDAQAIDAGAGRRSGRRPGCRRGRSPPASPSRPAATLSPGERTRAALALLQANGVNLLVLDEPTNHLDLPAIEQLEQALAGYPGTLLLVTHDRRMLDAVATTRHLELADGKVTQ